MAENSKIEWTHHTFNGWWGCEKVSPACKHCYAEAFAKRVGQDVWGPDSPRRFFGDAHWREPLKWNAAAAKAGERRRVFCASMADVFEDRSDLNPSRDRLWELIAATPWLDWLLLTKRPENVTGMVPWGNRWPRNVWLGTTAENQRWANRRIPLLLENPARIHFVSVEPLLGPVNLLPWMDDSADGDRLDWVIIGGESGAQARPMNPTWARSVRDQCIAAEVAFFFKQWGVWGGSPDPVRNVTTTIVPTATGAQPVTLYRVGKHNAGRMLDGRTWDEIPAAAIHNGIAA